MLSAGGFESHLVVSRDLDTMDLCSGILLEMLRGLMQFQDQNQGIYMQNNFLTAVLSVQTKINIWQHVKRNSLLETNKTKTQISTRGISQIQSKLNSQILKVSHHIKHHILDQQHFIIKGLIQLCELEKNLNSQISQNALHALSILSCNSSSTLSEDDGRDLNLGI